MIDSYLQNAKPFFFLCASVNNTKLSASDFGKVRAQSLTRHHDGSYAPSTRNTTAFDFDSCGIRQLECTVIASFFSPSEICR